MSSPAAAALAAMGYPSQGLYHSVVNANKQVLCAHCHASEALGTGGAAGVPPLTAAMLAAERLAARAEAAAANAAAAEETVESIRKDVQRGATL